MPARTKSRPRRRGSALSLSCSHAPFSHNSANGTGLYGGLQKELGTIQRLKLSCIAGEAKPSEDIYLELVAAYKTIYRSLLQHLDHLGLVEGGGPMASITKLEIYRVCEDGAIFIKTWFLPSAKSLDYHVFLRKSAADLRRYICMTYGVESIETRLHSGLAFSDYSAAFGIASEQLNPTNLNRLGLTLNFALFYHEVLGQDQHACHLAKFGFDEAVTFIEAFPERDVPEDSFLALSMLKEHMISWTSLA